MTFTDKTLVCKECGSDFLFTAGEQEFYQSRSLQNEPGRCPECRAAKKRGRSFGDGGGARQMHPIVCDNCGKDAEVPFVPRLGRPTYCSDCFASLRESGQSTFS